MATSLPNRASLQYTYGDQTGSASSNTTVTTLLDEYTVSLTKVPVAAQVEAGSDAAYILQVENTGAGVLYNPSVTDDLGTGTSSTAPLSYVTDSARFYYNGDEISGTVTTGTNNVTFSTGTTLQPGEHMNVVYAAKTAAGSSEDIENTATVTANSGSTSGAAVTDTATAQISFATAANVIILKTADSDSVISGDELSYTFTLVNTGNQAADSVTITDALPTAFTVSSISYTADGVTSTVSATDYTITSSNTLTLPASGSNLVISVPAADGTSPGVTTVTVRGIVR